REQQGVGGGDRLIRAQLLDELVGLRRVAAAEDGAVVVELTELVVFVALPAAEVHAIPVVDEGEDRAAHRGAWRALVAGGLPGLVELLDLLALLHVEGLARLVLLE